MNQTNGSHFSSAAPAHTQTWAGSAQASLHPTGITAHTGWAWLLPQVTHKQDSPFVCGAQTKVAHSACVSQNSLPLHI